MGFPILVRWYLYIESGHWAPHNCSLARGILRKMFQRDDVIMGYITHNLAISHYYDVIMGAMASQITSLTTVYSTVYSDAVQRKHQSSAPLAFVRGIHRGPVNSPHKWPVTRKMFPFDDVIMSNVRFSLTAFVEKLQEVIDIHVLWRWRFVTFVTFVFSSAWGVGIWLTSSTCWFSFFRGNRLVVWYCVQFFLYTALCHRVCSFHCIISHSYRAFCIWGKWKRK